MRHSALFLSCLALAGTACQRTDRSPNVSLTSPISATPSASLRETRWVLRQLGGQPIAAVPPAGQEPFLRITDAGTAEGQGSCNQFRASLKPATDDGQLQFGPVRSTRMACPALATEQRFTLALDSTRTYRISGDTLRLYANAKRSGTPLARLEAVYLR